MNENSIQQVNAFLVKLNYKPVNLAHDHNGFVTADLLHDSGENDGLVIRIADIETLLGETYVNFRLEYQGAKSQWHTNNRIESFNGLFDLAVKELVNALFIARRTTAKRKAMEA